MQGLAGLLGYETPFTDFVGDRRNTLMGLAGGMMGHRGSFTSGLGKGLQYAQQGRQMDIAENQMAQQEEARRQEIAQAQEQQNKTRQILSAKRPDLLPLFDAGRVEDAVNLYMKSEFPDTNGTDPTFSMTPVFMTDAEGNPKIGQMSNTGGVYVDGQIMNSLPQGWRITNRPQAMSNVDVGDQQLVFDPNTGTFRSGATIQGAPGTNMNVEGTGMDRTMTPAAGSPEAVSREQEAKQAEMRQFLRQTYADIVTEDIDRVLSDIENNPAMTTGVGAAITQGVPGTPAFNTKQLTDTIRANVGFDRLQQMRDASPTGGALGQVSEFENRLLQATLGNLELSQSLPQLKRNLERVREVYFKIVHEGISPNDPIAQEIGVSGGQSNGSTTGTGISWSIE